MKAVKACKIISYGEEGTCDKDDFLISEEPIQFIYNGVPHLVMMCTPIDLEDLAYGFSVTEGIVQNIDQILSVKVVESELGIELHIEIEPILMSRLQGAQRQMSARTGCGICGVEDLSLLERTLSIVKKVPAITYEGIQKSLRQSAVIQDLAQQTGASHAAFLCHRDGEVLMVREDVGRHVALDKLIGAIIRSELNSRDDLFILMSSRASFEIVQKTIAANISILVTMSAPTDKAVQLAKKYQLSLWGFARKGRVNCYTP